MCPAELEFDLGTAKAPKIRSSDITKREIERKTIGLLIVEGGLWVIGIILYLRSTHTRRFAGLVLWTFIVVLTALWLLSFNGAPPPRVHVLVTVDLILFPIVFGWAYWIDRLRQPNETSAHL